MTDDLSKIEWICDKEAAIKIWNEAIEAAIKEVMNGIRDLAEYELADELRKLKK